MRATALSRPCMTRWPKPSTAGRELGQWHLDHPRAWSVEYRPARRLAGMGFLWLGPWLNLLRGNRVRSRAVGNRHPTDLGRLGHLVPPERPMAACSRRYAGYANGLSAVPGNLGYGLGMSLAAGRHCMEGTGSPHGAALATVAALYPPRARGQG